MKMPRGDISDLDEVQAAFSIWYEERYGPVHPDNPDQVDEYKDLQKVWSAAVDWACRQVVKDYRMRANDGY